MEPLDYTFHAGLWDVFSDQEAVELAARVIAEAQASPQPRMEGGWEKRGKGEGEH